MQFLEETESLIQSLQDKIEGQLDRLRCESTDPAVQFRGSFDPAIYPFPSAVITDSGFLCHDYGSKKREFVFSPEIDVRILEQFKNLIVSFQVSNSNSSILS